MSSNPRSITSSTTATSSLIFPTLSQNINALSATLSSSQHSIHNRLSSIAQDAEFVSEVVVGDVLGCEGARGLGVVANERCGSWYVEERLRAGREEGRDGGMRKEMGSCYFKSTDGHFGQWSFSFRRLNVQLFDVIAEYGGCIIVDSTRRGKHLPDALAKTIPIWCATFNRLLFPSEEFSHTHGLERLPEAVSNTEHAQIEARLDGFVQEAKKLDLDLHALRKKLRAPLKPIWIVRSLNLPRVHDNLAESPSRSNTQTDGAPPFHPVYLLMASLHSAQSTSVSDTYVQGAADDAESWAHGLTAPIFWAYKDLLLDTPEDDLPEVIADCCAEWEQQDVDRQDSAVADSVSVQIAKAPWLSVGVLPRRVLQGVHIGRAGSNVESYDQRPEARDRLVVVCAPGRQSVSAIKTTQATSSNMSPQARPDTNPITSEPSETTSAPAAMSGDLPPNETEHQTINNVLWLDCNANAKLGARDLRTQLPHLLPYFTRKANIVQEVLVCCPTGTDLAIGVALAIICLWCGEDGKLLPPGSSNQHIDKELVKRRLSWLVTAVPGANPSRTTLKAVNDFLMSGSVKVK